MYRKLSDKKNMHIQFVLHRSKIHRKRIKMFEQTQFFFLHISYISYDNSL